MAPALAAETLDPTNVSVSVMTAAGLSNQVNATYAGVPTVSSVVATGGPTSGQPAGPDTGGTPIEIDGSGFANQATMVTFADIATQFSFGTQFNLTASSDTKLTTHTVAQNPAVVDTQVCTVTDCSPPSSLSGDTSDEFILFPPGNPKIDSITPDSGSATGGTEVTITGENLGCVTNVSFGGVDADDATNQEALLDCGSTSTVTVTTPPGKVGTAPVVLSTVESDTSAGVSPASATFTYTQPPAQTVTVHRTGNGAGKVTSTPTGDQLHEEDVLAQLHLRDRRDAEGESLDGLELRRLDGGLRRQEDVQAHGRPAPLGDGEVHARELHRPEGHGQDARRGEAHAQGALLHGREDQARLLDQGEEGPRRLAEAEAGNAPQAQRQGEPRP